MTTTRKLIAAAVSAASLALASTALAQANTSNSSGSSSRVIPHGNASDGVDWGMFAITQKFRARNKGSLLLQNPILFSRAYRGALERSQCAANVGGLGSFVHFYQDDPRASDLPYAVASKYRTCSERGADGSYFLLSPAMAELIAMDRWRYERPEITALSDDVVFDFIGTEETELGPLDRYSRCLVLVAPTAAFNVFSTVVGSEAERQALETLAGIANNCKEPGYGSYDTTATLRRAALGMAALHWTMYFGADRTA